MTPRVYLDHNATSPIRPEVLRHWLRVAQEVHGNPSSLHASGRGARDVVDRAREDVARALGVEEEGIVFTSGGTEANNLAVQGVLNALGEDALLVTSTIEHSSVLEVARRREREGGDVAWLPVDEHGVPRLDALDDLPLERPVLVSLMAANNEVGSLSHLADAGRRLASRARTFLHVDAVQALGKMPVTLREWSVDLASFSTHKFGGPPGVGLLWKERGVPLLPLVVGGGQEGDVRPGTEDVPGIAAAALAVRIAVEEQPVFAERMRSLAGLFWSVVGDVDGVRLFGPPLDAARLPNTLCIGLPGMEGKVGVTRLDLEGVEVSAGSACASGSLEPSHVLSALGADESEARAALRVSFGWSTTEEDCRRAAAVLRNLARASHAR